MSPTRSAGITPKSVIWCPQRLCIGSIAGSEWVSLGRKLPRNGGGERGGGVLSAHVDACEPSAGGLHSAKRGWSMNRPPVWAQHGMVACGQPLAAQAGLEILRRGGSAVDAAITTNACLGLMEPTACGLGGDLFAITWDPGERTLSGLNASGRAPR